MSRKTKDEPKFVMMGALVYEEDVKLFREICDKMGSKTTDVIYAFIKAVNSGDIEVRPTRSAPFSS